jgi:hypothetical protein
MGLGCQSMSNTDKGVLAGGGLGAATGAAIGSMTGRAGPGAVIGGVVGAVAGGLTGNAIDNSEREAEARAAAIAAQRPPLSMQEVVQLTASGSSDTVIINQIRLSAVPYQLATNDILYLKENRVSEAVISELQASGSRPPVVYTAQPVYVCPEPPPVAVGVGFGYGRRW